MTNEINKPECEALNLQRMKNGGFQSVEDTLMEAFETALAPQRRWPTPKNLPVRI